MQMCIPAFITYKGSEQMPTIGNKIKFRAGTYASYAALLANNETDSDAVYFCTDTQQLFVGDKEYSRPVIASNYTIPSDDLLSSTPKGSICYSGADGCLYLHYGTYWKKIANLYNHPTTTAVSAAAVKVGKDANGHVVLGAALSKSDVGLGNVENKSSATIRGELTSSNVTTALGYTPPQTDTTYNNATTSTAGLMSSTDKTKLDSITPANLLTNSDIVVCTQAEYDAMQTRTGLLYFIKEA